MPTTAVQVAAAPSNEKRDIVGDRVVLGPGVIVVDSSAAPDARTHALVVPRENPCTEAIHRHLRWFGFSIT